MHEEPSVSCTDVNLPKIIPNEAVKLKDKEKKMQSKESRKTMRKGRQVMCVWLPGRPDCLHRRPGTRPREQYCKGDTLWRLG